MKTWVDQLNNQLILPDKPQRIISLVPSQTELLFDLGLDEEIIGVTQYCIHPAQKVRTKIKIGGTKRFRLNTIKQLNPDLIIANKEENYLIGVKQLQENYPVWLSDVKTLDDAYQLIQNLGAIVGKPVVAENLCEQIRREFSILAEQCYQSIRTAYIIWRKPYMVAANNTFINNMLSIAKLENVFADTERYPVITAEQLQVKAPELILLSSEPYPFQEQHIQELQTICPTATIKVVDGQMFSWYGSRLYYTPNYIMRCRESMRTWNDC